MTNPTNEAMQEREFFAYTFSYKKTRSYGFTKWLLYGEPNKFWKEREFAEQWALENGYKIMEPPEVQVELTRNMSGDPLLSLSNGQLLAMSDIIGMSEAVKLAQDDKKDAIRWRAFRARDTLPALEADDFLDLFEEDADALIDEQLAAKEA